MSQSTSVNIRTLERIKDRAINAAGAFSDTSWKQQAEAALELLCKIGNDFTGDDIWKLLEGTGVETEEPRALGAIITKYARDGRIYSVGTYRKSIRKESHRRPLAVWRPVTYKRNLREAA